MLGVVLLLAVAVAMLALVPPVPRAHGGEAESRPNTEPAKERWTAGLFARRGVLNPFKHRDVSDKNARLGAKISEGTASGASILMSSWGSPDQERIRPGYAGFAEDGYAGNGVIFSCILARLMLFSEARFVYQNRTTKKLWSNDGLAMLTQPWQGGSTGELLARMEQDASLAGNAFIRRDEEGGFLERLRPDLVTIISAIIEDRFGRQHRQVLGYYYDPMAWDGDRAPEFYPVEEVAHWSPIPDPLAQFRGMSWLTPIVREVNADTALTGYKLKYLENAATPNMVIKYEQQLTDDVIEAVGARMKARHGGVDNAFKTLILDRGADFTVVGSDLQKLEYTAVQAAGESRIASAGGVPGIVIGLKEGLQAATYSNYGQAMRRFADLTTRPNWRSACGSLAKISNVPSDSRLWFDTEDVAALREGEQERAKTFQTKSVTAQTLIMAGYDPASVADAVNAGDLTLLVHTGRVPTVLYQDGKNTTTPGGQA